MSVKELISRLSPTATIYEVARKAKCSHCETKGASDFRLLYVCTMREDLLCRLADVSNDFCGLAIDRWQFRFEKAFGAKRDLENETWAANATHELNSLRI